MAHLKNVYTFFGIVINIGTKEETQLFGEFAATSTKLIFYLLRKNNIEFICLCILMSIQREALGVYLFCFKAHLS